jgi:hypothetical protein
MDLSRALAEQEQAASDQRDVPPGDGVAEHLEHRLGEAMIQAIEASSASRVSSASASPICLARFCRSAGSLPARIAIKTGLSIPSTFPDLKPDRFGRRAGTATEEIGR